MESRCCHPPFGRIQTPTNILPGRGTRKGLKCPKKIQNHKPRCLEQFNNRPERPRERLIKFLTCHISRTIDSGRPSPRVIKPPRCLGAALHEVGFLRGVIFAQIVIYASRMGKDNNRGLAVSFLDRAEEVDEEILSVQSLVKGVFKRRIPWVILRFDCGNSSNGIHPLFRRIQTPRIYYLGGGMRKELKCPKKIQNHKPRCLEQFNNRPGGPGSV
ncbi:hypothetical protein CEXT_454121 [Caerostris extrusa]|uniref:Ribosomal protein S3 n=1 Tax=Caerostris extrusa TaxID=172846 RepID=A0AAV4P4U4_CAEEX|nr:hypothetical protein CEXT_454121 [Caerostris extrusa]